MGAADKESKEKDAHEHEEGDATEEATKQGEWPGDNP